MLDNDFEDTFFHRNINFLVKSLIVSACSYLESYLKDSAFAKVEEFNEQINNLQVPHSLVLWSVDTKKAMKQNTGFFKLNVTRDDIDRQTSPNIDKTISLFQLFGVDLELDDDFKSKKDTIGTIVNKRNQIVHHNHDASDVTVQDAISHIEMIISYLEILDRNFHKQNRCSDV